MNVASTAFREGEMIPKQYTCDGAGVSPSLAWAGVPEGAKSLALIMDDPDAPKGVFTHWVLFNLAASTRELPENVPAQETLENGARHGTNSFQKIDYGGACPPSGDQAHRYFFALYALDTPLALDAGATKEQLLKAMDKHIVAEGRLMGRYQR